MSGHEATVERLVSMVWKMFLNPRSGGLQSQMASADYSLSFVRAYFHSELSIHGLFRRFLLTFLSGEPPSPAASAPRKSPPDILPVHQKSWRFIPLRRSGIKCFNVHMSRTDRRELRGNILYQDADCSLVRVFTPPAMIPQGLPHSGTNTNQAEVKVGCAVHFYFWQQLSKRLHRDVKAWPQQLSARASCREAVSTFFFSFLNVLEWRNYEETCIFCPLLSGTHYEAFNGPGHLPASRSVADCRCSFAQRNVSLCRSN